MFDCLKISVSFDGKIPIYYLLEKLEGSGPWEKLGEFTTMEDAALALLDETKKCWQD